jgi:uncharacterized LabA/DUF88 family protein
MNAATSSNISSQHTQIYGNQMSSPNTNLALLIDGDTVSAKVIAGLMAEIANYGTASVRRIYDDWTSPQLASWKPCLLQHSITPIQQFVYTTSKNATDGAMIIDAMDLLYTNRFSDFCIVSSHSDFTRLAARIREQGIKVYGFGERKSNSAFIAACDKFMCFDVLVPEPEEQTLLTFPTPGPEVVIPVPSQSATRPLDPAARTALMKAVANAETYDDQWLHLAQVAKEAKVKVRRN